MYKKRIFSESPHPIIPFILFILFILILIPAILLAAGLFFITLIVFLAVLTLVFAILHLIVWTIIRNKFK